MTVAAGAAPELRSRDKVSVGRRASESQPLRVRLPFGASARTWKQPCGVRKSMRLLDGCTHDSACTEFARGRRNEAADEPVSAVSATFRMSASWESSETASRLQCELRILRRILLSFHACQRPGLRELRY